MWKFLLVLFLLAAVIYFIKGIRRVELGAVGLVIWLGRRTGVIRPEGLTWLPPLLSDLRCLYVGERQVDIPKSDYYTGDRARLCFKTTLRVAVLDPAKLFSQGKGTYEPFTREAYSGAQAGGEEANIALHSLAQNSIRESVKSLSVNDVMFEGRFQSNLRDRIHQELAFTVQRWGIGVVDIWLTDIEGKDKDLRRAVQAELRQEMEGRGALAAHRAEVAKGALFSQVALELIEDVHHRTGRQLGLEDVSHFLMSAYQNERSLDVALRSAGGHNDLMQMFYMKYLGVPLPGIPALPMGAGSEQLGGLPAAKAASSGFNSGSWTIGREGQIRIEGEGISRIHACLEVMGEHLTIVDLGSTNGTFVDHLQLEPHVLTPIAVTSALSFGRNATLTAAELLAMRRPVQVDQATFRRAN